MRLGVVKEKELVRALTKAEHTGYGLTLSMKALFVFLVNARPLNVPVYRFVFFLRQEKRGDGGVLPLQGISPQLPGYIKEEDGKDTEKLSQHAATQALSIKHRPAKGLLYPAYTTTHFTNKQNSRIAFLFHTDPFNLVHSENYRDNEVFWLPIWTPESINPPPLHQ